MTGPRVVGLDLSLSATGYARVTTGEPGVDLGLVRSKPGDPDVAARSRRLRRITREVTDLCSGANLVVVEGPSYGSRGAGTWDRAGLWWLVVARLTGARVPVVEVPPASLKTYATGAGNADKDRVLAAVVRRYNHVEVTGNDTADALVLAAIGCRFIGEPIDGDLPKTHLRAFDKITFTP